MFPDERSACKEGLGSWCPRLLFFILFLIPHLWAATQTVTLLSQLSPGKVEFSLPPGSCPQGFGKGPVPGTAHSAFSVALAPACPMNGSSCPVGG